MLAPRQYSSALERHRDPPEPTFAGSMNAVGRNFAASFAASAACADAMACADATGCADADGPVAMTVHATMVVTVVTSATYGRRIFFRRKAVISCSFLYMMAHRLHENTSRHLMSGSGCGEAGKFARAARMHAPGSLPSTWT